MQLKNGQTVKGLMNRILRIDLSTEKYTYEPMDQNLVRLVFGGRGLGVLYLIRHFLALEEQEKYKNAFLDVDPLSEDNVVVICTSPTTGTRMPTSGRIHMNYKSPLTDALGSTNAGGRWGVDFKKTGNDILIITGKAKNPVYLFINRHGVTFHAADHLKSLSSIQTREMIKESLSNKVQVLTIGVGGKKLSRFAAVLSDKGKALGRGGGGAVFGSKNLYAIAVMPDSGVKIEVANDKNLQLKNKTGVGYHVKLKLDMGKFTRKESAFGILSSMGSLGLLGMVDNFGQLIHNNMQDTQHDPNDINKINGEALRNHARRAKPGETHIKVKKGSCFHCPIICKRETSLVDADGNVIEKGEGPEFESVTLLGANLSIYDLTVITKANYLANHYGLDTISLGATIASFFELYQLLKEKKADLSTLEQKFLQDVNPFVEKYGEPGFGKTEILLPITDCIGQADGIGKYLAQGSFRFCQRYGHEELSMSVKKLELPAYDPRTSFSQALCYEMNNRGGCHLEGGYTAPHAYCAGYSEWPGDRIEGTPLVSKNATLKNVILDIIGACIYGSFSLGLDEYASLVCAVTGLDLDEGSLKNMALRTITLERVFNYLCGLTKNDDWLPDRFYKKEIMVRNKPAICDHDAFEYMHREYYNSVGWDDNGVPTMESMMELGLTEAIFNGKSPRDRLI